MTASTGGPITNVEQAGVYLQGLINFERKPGFSYSRMELQPILRLLAALGHPEAGLSIVHVAGSKGKGSTCLIAEAVLGAAGERVGTFTSPHLQRWTERFRVGGCETPGAALAAAVERVRPHVDRLRASDAGDAPTFFDATTAAALVLFADAGVSRVLLEVGLGGRLDSTNAVTPAVTCITSIEYEHTDKLGDTLALIAGEKAGILKPGVPCVIGRLDPEAESVVRARAAALGAPLARLGEEFTIQSSAAAALAGGLVGQQRLRFRDSDGFELEAQMPVLGEHQASNAALALAAIRRLGAHSDEALTAAARRGLGALQLAGRVELLGRRPWLLVDSAHTARSAAALASVLRELPARRRLLVLSISRDKPPRAILEALLPGAHALWLTRAESIRSFDPSALAPLAKDVVPELEIHVVQDPEVALRAARAALREEDGLCCTGSVYLAGIARALLAPS